MDQGGRLEATAFGLPRRAHAAKQAGVSDERLTTPDRIPDSAPLRPLLFRMAPLLALVALPGLAAPAAACRYSRSIITVKPVGGESVPYSEVQIRVDEVLLVRGMPRAVRATLLNGSGTGRLGGSIVIVVPPSDTANCYYGGLADPEAITSDGSLKGFVLVLPVRDRPGIFRSWLTTPRDASAYDAFVDGTVQGTWTDKPRFISGEPTP